MMHPRQLNALRVRSTLSSGVSCACNTSTASTRQARGSLTACSLPLSTEYCTPGGLRYGEHSRPRKVRNQAGTEADGQQPEHEVTILKLQLRLTHEVHAVHAGKNLGRSSNSSHECKNVAVSLSCEALELLEAVAQSPHSCIDAPQVTQNVL